MPRRYVCVVVFSFVMGLVAVFGYLFASPSPREPVRVVFENAGGRVAFDHKRHIVDYKADCAACHHTGSATKCGECHGVVFDEAFRKNHQATIGSVSDCLTCHHMGYQRTVQAHAVHLPETQLSCRSCHHRDKSIEPRPANCANCHTEQAEGNRPALKDAGHRRCERCHQKLAEPRTFGCRACHNVNDNRERWKKNDAVDLTAFSARCTDCHTSKEIKELIPGRMDAFHGSCLPCHEKLGKGPHTKDQCKQCHTN